MDDANAGATRIAGGGLATGLAAWLGGYLVTYLLAGTEIENSVGSAVLELATNESVTWKLVGWLFFNAHNVTVTVPGLFGESAQNFLAAADGVATTALFAVPPALLGLAGAAAAWGAAPTPARAARNGAAVLLGYLPLSVAGTALFAVSVGDAAAGPTLVTAVMLAGVVYPVCFGAVGGLIGGHLSAA